MNYINKRIQNTLLTVVLSFGLTFFASIMILSEWHYHENRLSPIGFKILSILTIFAYSISYYNLFLNILDKSRLHKRETLQNILLIIYLVFQSIFTLTVFLSLTLITLDL